MRKEKACWMFDMRSRSDSIDAPLELHGAVIEELTEHRERLASDSSLPLIIFLRDLTVMASSLP